MTSRYRRPAWKAATEAQEFTVTVHGGDRVPREFTIRAGRRGDAVFAAFRRLEKAGVPGPYFG